MREKERERAKEGGGVGELRAGSATLNANVVAVCCSEVKCVASVL